MNSFSDDLARFLALKATVANSANVHGVAASAVRERFVKYNLQSPTDNGRVHKVMRGISKKLGRPPKQARPMTPHAMRTIIHTHLMNRPERNKAETLKAWRTVVRLRLCFGSAMRSNEVLNLQRGDITFHKDEEGKEFLQIHVQKAKNDQEKKGDYRLIPESADKTVCAVKMMRRYLACVDADPETPIQQRIQVAPSRDEAYFVGDNITKNTADEDRKLILEQAGFEENAFTEHSGRRGAAVTLKEAGCSNEEIQVIGNWKSTTMPAYYSKGAVNSKIAIAKKIM